MIEMTFVETQGHIDVRIERPSSGQSGRTLNPAN